MKYKLTSNKKNGLSQIQALIDIPLAGVKLGDLGGYVESEANLSQNGAAWVCEGACVSGNAHVFENAQVYGNAYVFGNARVFGNAYVFGNARVFGNAQVYGNTRVFGNAPVSGNAYVFGGAYVFENAQVFGTACVFGNARVRGDAMVSDPYGIITVVMQPYDINITRNTISIGCHIKSRYGEGQWSSLGHEPETVKLYAPILKVLKKQLPRRKN